MILMLWSTTSFSETASSYFNQRMILAELLVRLERLFSHGPAENAHASLAYLSCRREATCGANKDRRLDAKFNASRCRASPGFVEPDDRLGQCVVARIANAATEG
jgi:hypothetical protein